MIHSRTLGLPSSLAEVGTVLGIEQQKMSEGKALIKFFCTHYDVSDGVPQFHNPSDYPEKWETFKAYNKRDVEAEMEIDRKLSRFPVPDFIWREFYLDQEINDRGILVDMELADAAITLDESFKYCAPIAGALGFSCEDTAEALGLMANAGIKSTQSGTSMRSIMTALSGDVKFCSETFGEMEIATTNQDGSMRELSDILADCRVAFNQMTESEKASAAQALVGKNVIWRNHETDNAVGSELSA